MKCFIEIVIRVSIKIIRFRLIVELYNNIETRRIEAMRT